MKYVMTSIFLAITLAAMLAVLVIDAAQKRREYLQRSEKEPTSGYRWFSDVEQNRVYKFSPDTANHGIK